MRIASRVMRFCFCMRTKEYTCALPQVIHARKSSGASAGIIVIGDEILKGQVQDTNSNFIARHLFELGIKVNKICVVSDDEDAVAEEVRTFSKAYTYVITTGGIGPTHDDITFNAIAKAFGESVKPHPELVKICADYFQLTDLSSPAMKLAHVPESAKLTYGYDTVKQRQTLYPNISVHNVYIFPGIPSLLERLFMAVYKELFRNGSRTIFVKDLYVSANEVTIASQLNKVVANFPTVSIGSYPQLFNRYYQVHLTIQSENEEEMHEAYKALQNILPEGCIVNFDSNPLRNSYEKILNLSTLQGKSYIQKTVDEVGQYCTKYKTNEICLLFDGKAYSTAMIHLLHACFKKNSTDGKLNGVNFIDNLLPKATEQYIFETQHRYNILIENYHGPINTSLINFVSQCKQYKIVFIGCPLECPDGHTVLEAMSACPGILWVNPLKNWKMPEVWNFIDSLYLPYNSAYDIPGTERKWARTIRSVSSNSAWLNLAIGRLLLPLSSDVPSASHLLISYSGRSVYHAGSSMCVTQEVYTELQRIVACIYEAVRKMVITHS